MEGGEKGKSRFFGGGGHGKDERWCRWEFNEGNLGNKEAQYVSCTEKNKNNNTKAVVMCATKFFPCCCCFVCVYAPGPYGGVNTVTYPGHLIQIRR